MFCAASSRSQTPSLSHLHGGGGGVIDITEEAQATVHQESSEAVSALLASQNAESTALSPYLALNPSPVSSPPVPPSPSPSEGGRRTDVEPVAARSLNNKMEFAPSDVIRYERRKLKPRSRHYNTIALVLLSPLGRFHFLYKLKRPSGAEKVT